MPNISLVIPTYNRPELLERAIESVLAQTLEDLEIVVVDDGSEADTASVVEGFEDDRLRFVAHEVNRGVAAARNTGIEHATGEYVAFLDSDDEWLPGKLAAQLEVLEAGDHGVAYCGLYTCDDKTDRVNRASTTFHTGDVYATLLGGWCPATTSLIVAKRSLLETVGGFESEIPSFEDYDLWLRLAREATFGAVESPLVVKHEHSGEQISIDPETRRYGLQNFLEKWEAEISAMHGSETVERVRREHLAAVLRTEALEAAMTEGRLTMASRWIRYMRLKDEFAPTDLVRLFILFVGGPELYERVSTWVLRHRWQPRSIVEE